MAGNRTLSARNRAALDEWYTQLADIGKSALCSHFPTPPAGFEPW
jgi:hypothetical protein